MFHLLLVDDRISELEELQKGITEFCRNSAKISVKVVKCPSEESMWDNLQEYAEKKIVVFMRIHMMQQNKGIELSKEINGKYPGVLVVFLEEMKEYTSEIYEADHGYFMAVDQMEKSLSILFNEILPIKMKKNNYWIGLRCGYKAVRVAQADILYFERNLRKTIVHMKTGEQLETAEKLSSLLERLNPHEFVRCHNSYIVNLKEVEEIQGKELCMKQGTSLNISRAYLSDVKRCFSGIE